MLKKMILSAACLASFVLVAGTFDWVGAGANTKWSNPANWSGNKAPVAKEDVCVFNIAEDLETEFDLGFSPVIEKRGAGKLMLAGEKKYENTVKTGSLFLYEGSIDLGGGKCCINQSKDGEAAIAAGSSLFNAMVSYYTSYPGDGPVNGIKLPSGTVTLGKGVELTANSGQMLSYGATAVDTRTVVLDGAIWINKANICICGATTSNSTVNDGTDKPTVVELKNGAKIHSEGAIVRVGVNFNGGHSPINGAGILKVTDSSVVMKSGQFQLNDVDYTKSGNENCYSLVEFDNSMLTVYGDYQRASILTSNRSSANAKHSYAEVVLKKSTATLWSINAMSFPYTGKLVSLLPDGYTGILRLNGSTLIPLGDRPDFIYHGDNAETPAVKLEHVNSVIDTDFDVTVSAVAFGDAGWTKKGEGTLTLSGANIYTGVTRVEAGTLNLSGSVAGVIEVIGAEFTTDQSSTPFRLVVNRGKASFNSIEPAVVDALTIGENGGALSFLVKGFTINNISGDLSKLTIESKLAEWGLGEVLKSNSPEFLEWVRSYFAEKAPEGVELSVSGASLIATMSEEKTTTWSGLGEDSLWSTSDNWSEGVPSVYGSISFGSSEKTDIELNSPISLTAVEFSAVAPSYSVSGSGAITVVGGLTNFSEKVQTFNVPVVFLPDTTIPLHTAGDIAFAAGIGGSDIIKTGSGNAIFTSSYNGKLAIREGGVVLSPDGNGSIKLSEEVDALSIAGLLDLGGGSLAINQSENGESVFKDGAVLKNGSFTYACPKKVWNSSNENGTALIWNKGTITVGEGAVFSPAGQLFAYGPSAPAETHGERRILVDGGELVLGNSPIFIIGVNNDWEKGAIIEVTNGGRLTSNYGNTIMIGARNNGAGTSNSAKGLLVASNGSLIDVKNNVWLLNPATHKNYGRIALTNSTMIIRADNGLSIMPVGDSSESDVGVDVASGAVLSAKVINVKPYEGTGILTGRRVGGITLDNGTLQSRGGKNPFISYSGSSGPGIELLAGGGIIDTQEYNVTNNVVVYGEGSLKKIGSGSLTLSAINTYTGTTLVSEGTLRLTGRVAGGVQVASGASLELSFPAEGEEAPEVPNLLMEEGSALKAIVPGLPEGVKRIDVLRSSGEISIPYGGRDESGNVFYVSSTSTGKILRYGQKQGFVLIVR